MSEDQKNNEAPKLEIKQGPVENMVPDDQTAKIPKPKSIGMTPQKVVLNAGTDSAVRPSDRTTMAPAVVPPAAAEETIAMDRDEVKDLPKVAASPAVPDAVPITKEAKSKTIKLKPLKPNTPANAKDQEETISMDRGSLIDSEMPSTLGGAAPAASTTDDEATIKIQKPKPSNKPATPMPNIPGSKATIRLRPSENTPAAPVAGAASEISEEQTVSLPKTPAAMSKKTIRLVPKKPGEDDATQKTVKPSAPTVKLDDAPPAEAPAPPAADSGKRTLKLKSSAKTVALPQGDAEDGAPPPPSAVNTVEETSFEMEEKVDRSGEPNIVLTLVAVVALILAGYCAWLVAGQWAELNGKSKNAKIPGRSGKIEIVQYSK